MIIKVINKYSLIQFNCNSFIFIRSRKVVNIFVLISKIVKYLEEK